MIGSGLIKLAQQNGMKIAKGVAYGSLQGYAATMCEGAGFKQIVITTRFQDPQMQTALQQVVNQRNVSSEFRVKSISFASNGICVEFLNNPGTMKKIEAFLAWFMPLLPQYGATQANICTECGQPIAEQGNWVLRDGTAAFHVHNACGQKLQREITEANQQRLDEDQSSYVQGAIGAIGGALVGAVLWAVIWIAGYMASLVGLAIGWLAEKGYTLLHGKIGKGKVVILVAVTILAVIVGTMGGLVAQVVMEFVDMGAPMSMELVSECVQLVLEVMAEDSEFAAEVVINLLMGIVFAMMGVFGILSKAKKEAAGELITVLE